MTEDAFLQAIRENPADDQRRAVYADWLEDQGDPRAELIRLSRGVPTCRAIISDIHGNLEALQAVLAEIEAWNIQEIFCLGDVVGYGPNPRECIDLVMPSKLTLCGNHDQGVMFDPEGWSPVAEKAIYWTRDVLESPDDDSTDRERRWEFLAGLPRTHKEGKFLYVHGSPRNPLNEYIFPEDVYNERKIDRIFEQMDRWCFHGHTHLPGVITQDRRFIEPSEINYLYHFDDQKTLCNVGSVGQPRDGDWRASYVILIGETIHFRRVEYDLETTVQKIFAVPELENFLGERLRAGR